MARWISGTAALAPIFAASAALADPVGLTPDMMSVTVETPAARSRSCASRTTRTVWKATGR
jgi:hypothetical protein